MSVRCHLLAGNLGSGCLSAKFIPPYIPEGALPPSQPACHPLLFPPACGRRNCWEAWPEGRLFFSAHCCSFLILAQQLQFSELSFYCSTVKRRQQMGPSHSNRAGESSCERKQSQAYVFSCPCPLLSPFLPFRKGLQTP